MSSENIIKEESEKAKETTAVVTEPVVPEKKTVIEEEVYEIYTTTENLSAVCEALGQKGYSFLSAEAEMVPSNYITLTDEDQIKNMQKLLDHLEENDDVQNVWHNWDEQ